MSKMFVHYSGTVASFKEAKKSDGKRFEEFYNNHVVFIKGGTDGNGAAIYTHGEYFGDVKDALAALQTKLNELKYFSKISDGTNVAEVSVNNGGTISIQGEDPAVTTKIDPTGIKIGLSDAFKKAVNEDLPAAAAAAKKAGEDAAAAVDAKLGEKGAAAASGSEATAFGRIKNLEEIVAGLTGTGEGDDVQSVGAQITNAINELDVTALEGEYVASISQVNGLIVPVMGTFNFDEAGAADTAKSEVIGATADASTANTIYGAKKYADEKAAAAQSAAETTAAADATEKANKALNDAKAYADGLVAEGSALEVRVKANETAIGVLNGEGEGSVKKSVADAIAGVVANAPEDFDTLKEVADWIGSDTTGAAQMQADIATLKGADTIEGSVAKTVKDAVDAEAAIARAAEKQNADDIDAAEGRIKTIEDDYLKAADKTELNNAINAKVAQSAYDTKMQELAEADSDNFAAAKKYADDAIAALDVTDAAVENQFVTAVSETDGKIAVSRSAINASQISISNTETDEFDAATVNVQDALTELASFWAWEDL